jgi:hypothetical protein
MKSKVTVKIKIDEYNDLIGFKNSVLGGPKVAIYKTLGLFSLSEIKYFTDNEISLELGAEIRELNKKTEALKRKQEESISFEEIKKMSYFSLLNLKLNL